MAEMLLINPRKRRRKARKARRTRARNPITTPAARYQKAIRKAKSNPRRRRRRVYASALRRRRRNPVAGGIFRGLMPMVQNAAIGAVGSVAVDFTMGKLNPMLPSTLQVQPGTVGAGDAVKAVITVAMGQLLSRFTRGMSKTAAQGALTVQMDRIVRNFLPADIKSQLAYASAGYVVPGSARIPPVANMRVGAYTRPGATALLNAYTRPGATALLNGAREREGSVR